MFPETMEKRSTGRMAAALILLLAIMPATGCLILPDVLPDYGIEDPDKRLAFIEPGKTSKRELLKRLGPPVAIAAQDEKTVIPLIYDMPFGHARNAYTIRSDAWFELFATEHRLAEYHRIYYYHSLRRSGIFMLFWLVNYRSRSTETDRMWFLVNERTGAVEDYAFKKHGKPVLFGAQP